MKKIFSPFVFVAAVVISGCGSEVPMSTLGSENGGGSITTLGGAGGTTPTTAITPTAAPTIIGFTPTSGAAGTTVIITGSNFVSTLANNTVAFNGVTATVTAATATSITATVPAGATTGTISIATADGNATSTGSFTVINSVGTTVTSLSVIDANKMPIGGGDVTVKDASGVVVSTGVTTNTGVIAVNLPPGLYVISVTRGIVSTATIDISNVNTNASATVIIPAVPDAAGTSMADVSTSAVVASLSGQITSAGIPVVGATVSLSSANAATVASTVTDANGNYLLKINVNNALATAGVFVGNFRVSKSGYMSIVSAGHQVVPSTNIIGKSFSLTQTGSSTALYSESFESSLAPTNCGNWTIVNSAATVGWHVHGAAAGIVNAAYTQGLVSLAPDDLSLGAVPDPIGGNGACWYGAPTMGANADERGNFMGVTGSNIANSLSGGQGLMNHGAVISPAIDLTAVPAGTALTLVFETYWEIESVNPNNLGFDIMEIDYSLDNGATWTGLARLNPLSDPSTGAVNRSPIPFTNAGYNAAPLWNSQEPIPLVDTATGVSLAGKSIKLRFAFDTVDGLFNGFRGWMIDDLAVYQGVGTYPIMAAGAQTAF